MEMTEKPTNVAELEDEGRAILEQLAQPYLVIPTDYGAQWLGEPVALPAAYYRPEPSPSGYSLLGWRLTEAGMAAWRHGTRQGRMIQRKANL
jgi:hypothetical protein